MSAHATTEHAYIPGEIAKPNTGWIWKTFWVLVIITAVEFAIAFTLTSPDWRTFRNSIFIVLTILKAFFHRGRVYALEARGQKPHLDCPHPNFAVGVAGSSARDGRFVYWRNPLAHV